MTDRRFAILTIGWTSRKVQGVEEILLDTSFSYGMKRGSTLASTPVEKIAKGARMNTLYPVKPGKKKSPSRFRTVIRTSRQRYVSHSPGWGSPVRSV